MIPAPFGYLRPDSVDGCVAALAEHGDEAKVLAGGHSLLPLMKLRLASPGFLVDIGRIAELQGVADAGDHLVIGAGTTHHAVMTDPLVRRHCGVLAQATALVADPQVRHRGTLGGALAHGDAAGDLPAVALAVDATLVALGPSGSRDIGAADFFVDHLQTALQPGEVLTHIRVPKLDADAGWRWHYEKFTRAAHMWAVVGSCAVVNVAGDTVTQARVALTNMAAVPVRATATEAALTGHAVPGLESAADLAAEGTSPPHDLNADAEYRSHLARVLTRRALLRATA